MALPDDVLESLKGLESQSRRSSPEYTRLDRYYEGEQRLEQIGIAVPPELQMFKAAVNVPRMAVDEVVRRQRLKGFQRSGSDRIDDDLRQGWEANNLDSQSTLAHQDARIFGRSFVSVSTNPDDAEQPLITVESPEGMAVDIDARRRMRKAARFYTDERVRHATLYLPDATWWVKRDRGLWVEASDPDEHGSGVVPLVMLLNRQRTGRWTGTSEMKDVIEKTDAVARLITNMQVGGEALAWPKRWVAGVDKKDFVDKNGKPIPEWESYMAAIAATANANARFGQFDAADLGNFYNAVNALLAWCAAELGLPLRFMGQEAVNPASEGAIKADLERLVANVESKNRFDGDSWSWVMGLRDRFLGRDSSNSIRALWFDPQYPTQAQLADSILKLRQDGVLSREGAWDELGWDEPRKVRERGYFAAEAMDPLMQAVLNGVDGG